MRDHPTIGAVRVRASAVPTEASEVELGHSSIEGSAAGLSRNALGPRFMSPFGAAQFDPSAHCAPALHPPTAIRSRDLERFHDHDRHDHAWIETMFSDGSPEPQGGAIAPDLARPTHGPTLEARDADAYAH